MLLLLSLLAACNPEHNPADVAEISYLQGAKDQVTSSLSAAKSERDVLQEQVDSQAEALEAFGVVARAYQTSAGLSGDELVVCYPADEIVPEDLPPLPGTRTEPWVQAEVSPDCNEPTVLSLVEKEVASEPVASVEDAAPYNSPYRAAQPE